MTRCASRLPDGRIGGTAGGGTGLSANGSVYDAATHLKLGTGEIVITDPLFKAGYTGSLKTAHLWEAYGLRCAVHGSDVACLHAALAIPSCRYFESWVPEGFLQTHGIRTAATEIDANGNVRPWQTPGLGIEFDEGFLNQYTVGMLEFHGAKAMNEIGEKRGKREELRRRNLLRSS